MNTTKLSVERHRNFAEEWEEVTGWFRENVFFARPCYLVPETQKVSAITIFLRSRGYSVNDIADSIGADRERFRYICEGTIPWTNEELDKVSKMTGISRKLLNNKLSGMYSKAVYA